MADATPAGTPQAPASTTPPAGGDTILGTPPAGAPTTGTSPAGTPPAAPAAFEFYKDGKPTDAFLSAFPEENKTARSTLLKYKDMASLAKGIEGLQYLAGQKGFEKPADDAPQSVKDAFTAKLRALNGVPENADAYGLGKAPEKLPEGVTWDAESAKAFQQLAFDEGLSPATVQKIIAFQMKMTGDTVSKYMAQQAQARSEAAKTLREQFGSNYDQNIVKAQAVAEKFGFGKTEENGKFNIDPSLGNNASFIMGMAKIAEALGESVQLPGTQLAQKVSNDQSMRDLSNKAIEAYNKGDMKGYQALVSQQRDLASRMK